MNCRKKRTGISVHLYPVYTIKLARRAGYMLAGRASSMFARRLLDVCFMFAMLYACFIFARCLLDRVNGALSLVFSFAL